MRSVFRIVGAVAIVLIVSLGTYLVAPPSQIPAQDETAHASPVEWGDHARTLSLPAAPASPAAATLNWSNLSIPDSSSPPPRISAAMVWDSTDSYGLLFGGEYTNTTTLERQYYNDTWSYLGGVWTNRTTSTSPSQRFAFGLADDPADHEVVLFGGEPAHGLYLNDTWTYKAGVWTNITKTAGTPPPRGFWMSMAYDSATTSVLLFGGVNQTSDYANDTWSFKGGTWTELHPTVLPPGRHAQEMIFDAADGEMVMFGGLGAISYLNDTWTYSGGNWAPIPAGNHPSTRIAAGMAFDGPQGKLVLYGGYPSGADYYSTWLFSAGAWTQNNVTNSPPNPSNPYGQMIYDPTDNYVFLFYEVDSYGPIMGNWAFRFSPQTTYSVTFNEIGLPSGTNWGVRLNGTPGASTTNTIVFTVTNSTDPWTVSPVTGYAANVSSGSVIVKGAAQTVYLRFSAVGPTSYPVTFVEKGLAAATMWNVSLEGTRMGSTTSSIVFSEVDGRYSFAVPPVPGYTASPSSGEVTVNGTAVQQNITFTPGSGALTATLRAVPATFLLGTSTNLTTVTAGGTPPFRYAYTGLPRGCGTANLPTLSCTPNATGTSTVTVTITDDLDHTAQANATITVQGPSSSSPSSGSSSWLWILLIVIVIAVLLIVVLLSRRRKKGTAPPPATSPLPPPTPPPAGPPPT